MAVRDFLKGYSICIARCRLRRDDVFGRVDRFE